MRFFFSWQNSYSCAKWDLTRISRSDCQIIGDDQSPLPTALAWLLKNFEFHIIALNHSEVISQIYLHLGRKVNIYCAFSKIKMEPKIALKMPEKEKGSFPVFSIHVFALPYSIHLFSRYCISDLCELVFKVRKQNIVCCKSERNLSWGD